MFVEMLNDHYEEWLKILHFKHAKILQSKNTLKGIDVAFVEGAITSPGMIKELRAIRRHAKRVVAIGSCAVQGMPAAQRNNFNEKTQQEIAFLIDRFNQLPKVLTVKDVVQVDYEVPGCPMDETAFLETLQKCLQEFHLA